MSRSYGLVGFVLFCFIELSKFFIFSGHQSFIIHVFYKYFLPAYVLSLHFINSVRLSTFWSTVLRFVKYFILFRF